MRKMRQLTNLMQPYYLLRPDQMARRMLHRRPAAGVPTTASLLWGSRIMVRGGDTIGRTILANGVFDLTVTEALWRLVEPGDRCVDIGANVGYMARLMAVRSGLTGHVDAFEPHPAISRELRANAQSWDDTGDGAPIQIHEAAVSDRTGTARLVVRPWFDRNRGSSSVADRQGIDDAHDGTMLEIVTTTLDDVVGDRPVGVVKVDVEGHEHAVFAGARLVLGQHRARDVVFEAHTVDERSIALFRSAGYTLFRLARTFRGPRLLAVGDRAPRRSADDPSLLATVDPLRARQRLEVSGWRSLRPYRHQIRRG